jgi:hypothetical protein
VYLKEVTSRAVTELKQAEVDGAKRHAPFEYSKAVLYLEKAREDAGHSNFQNAIEWGRRSQDCSRRASALAKSAKKVGHPEETPRPNQNCGEI